MVCTGNICRSPTAEAVLQKTLDNNGWSDFVHLDSAGTHRWNIGDAPDPRSQHHASLRGYTMNHLCARQVTVYDLDEFDLLLGMEQEHVNALHRLADTPQQQAKIKLYLDFSAQFNGQNMADPYYGGERGFETVLDQIEDATPGIIRFLQEQKIIPC